MVNRFLVKEIFEPGRYGAYTLSPVTYNVCGLGQCVYESDEQRKCYGQNWGDSWFCAASFATVFPTTVIATTIAIGAPLDIRNKKLRRIK